MHRENLVIPPSQQRAAKILLGLAVSTLLALVYSTANRLPDLYDGGVGAWRDFVFYYALPLLSMVAVLASIAFSSSVDKLLCLAIIAALLAAAYSAEVYLHYVEYNVKGRSMNAAKQRNIEFDARTLKEVVMDLRAKGEHAVPSVTIRSDKELSILGLMPKAKVVTCNEFGPWYSISTDRYGFNNPDYVWDLPEFDLILLGDSYTAGQCDPLTGGFAELLRKSGLKVLNLGIGGNGPVENLATLVEYASTKRAKRVMWIHYAGNDLSGLFRTNVAGNLLQYVDDKSFSQDLPNKTARIVTMLQSKESEALNFVRHSFIDSALTTKTLGRVARLYLLRNAFGLARNVSDDTDFQLFKAVMTRARDVTGEMHANFTVISLPASGQLMSSDSELERQAAATIRSLGIEFVDLKPIIQMTTDPYLNYSHGRKGGHLTPEGNTLVSRVLLDYIKP